MTAARNSENAFSASPAARQAAPALVISPISWPSRETARSGRSPAWGSGTADLLLAGGVEGLLRDQHLGRRLVGRELGAAGDADALLQLVGGLRRMHGDLGDDDLAQ